MFLLILDENPLLSAEFVPDKLKFKQLLELCQLVNSEFDFGYMKKIPQGKKIQKWIRENTRWVFYYYSYLLLFCTQNVKLKKDTLHKLQNTLWELNKIYSKRPILETGIFRYSKDYKCEISTDTELPIDECIEQYKKYVEWKKLSNVKYYN